MKVDGNSSIRSITTSIKSLEKVFEKLASGKRINRASDDAAGLAVLGQLESEAAVLKVASRNSSDLSSAVQIASSAQEQIGNIATRLGELSAQSANGTLSDDQRVALQQEFEQLTQEAQRIQATTQFNGVNLLQGGSTTGQVGSDSSANSQITVQNSDLSVLLQNLSSQSIGTQAGAQATLDQTSSFIQAVSQERGNLGSFEARIESARENSENRGLAVEASASRIRDADIAQETAELARTQILLNSSTALVAQAGRLNADSVGRLLA